MKKNWLSFFAALMLFSSLAVAQTSSDKGSSKEQSLTGVVSDAMCGAKHMMPGDAASCTRACVKQGSKYALVVGDKVYTLTGHSEELDKLAGQQATVTGKVNGDKVDVTSVKGS
jgi:hypothetical protein